MNDNRRGENMQKVNNQHFDEAVELSDDGSGTRPLKKYRSSREPKLIFFSSKRDKITG